jgi:hypothetical protein
MFLGQQQHLVIQQTPIARIFTEGDNSDKDTGSGSKIRGLEITPSA